jgi:hypothetical protein
MTIEVPHHNNCKDTEVDQYAVEVMFVESDDHLHQKQTHS